MSIVGKSEFDGPLNGEQMQTFQRGLAALSQVLGGTRAAQGGRLTQDRPGFAHFTSNMMTIIPPTDSESTWRVLDLDLISLERVSPHRISELLADLSPEMSSGVNDWLRFVNPGVSIVAVKPGTKDPDNRAQAALDEDLATLRRLYGTLDVVINRLIMAGYLRGAYLAEGVLDKRGRQLVDLATPDPATIRFRRAWDEVRGDIFEMGQWQGGTFVLLDRPTIKYIPLDPFPGKPYGRPMVNSAIFLALFNIGLLRDIRRVVAQQGYPRLDLEINLQELFASLPPQLQTVDQFADWAARQLKQVESQYASVRPEDAYIHFSPVKVNRPVGVLDSHSLGAVEGLTKTIERGLARGLKTSPIIMGLTDGTSEAQANRQWEIHAARVKAAQHPLETMLSDIFTAGLNARGLVAEVLVEFSELRSAEYQRDEQVRQLKLTNADLAYKAGYITLEAAAKYGFDVDELPAEEERYVAPAPVVAMPAQPADQQLDPNAMENPEPGSKRVAWVQDGVTWRRMMLTFPDDRRRPRDGKALPPPDTRHNEPGSHPDWNGFGHYSDGDDWGVSKQAGYRDTLTGFQLEGLQVFKGNNYTAMNTQLRTGKPTSTKVNGLNLSTHIANAKDAIARDKAKISRNMVVYRGMESKHIAANFDKVKVGHEFSDKGFNSTSFNPSVAKNFAAGKDDGIVIKVHMKRGTHAAYLDHPDIDKDEFGESEMLLHPNTKYRVLRARVDKHGNKVLSVEVVHDGVHAIPATGAKKRAAPLLSTPEGAAPEFVHEGGPCPKARPERFGVNSLDLVGADDMIYLEDEEGDTPGGDQKKRASSSRARAPFTPAGAGESLPPGDPAVDDDDVDEAVDDFDEELPDYAGLLDADVVEE